MKTSRIAQIIAGIVFFILAVLLSFSLLMSLFEPGGVESGFKGWLLWLGLLIRNFYGISSILIPVFFFAVSMVCLIAQITFKKCIYISCSLIPFFTAVISEKIYRSAPRSMQGPIEAVKLVLTVLATLLIMAIEFLLSGIIAERLAFNRNLKKRYLRQAFEEDDSDLFESPKPFSFEQSSETESITQTETDNQFETIAQTQENEISDDEDSPYKNDFDDVPLYDAFSENEISQDDLAEDSYDENKIEEDEINEDDIIYDQNELSDYNDNDSDSDEEYQQNDDVNDEFTEGDFSDSNPSDPTMIETNLEDSHGVSDIFSQMDKDIRDSLEDEPDLSPDEQLDQELTNYDEYADESGETDEADGSEDSPDAEDSGESDDADDNRDSADPAPTEDPPQSEPASGDDTPSSEPVAETEKISVKEAEAAIKQEQKASRPLRKGPYKIPTDGLLEEFEDQKYWIIDSKTDDAAAQLKETLEEFKISAEVTGIRKGPVVTMFEILPAPGVKLSKIVALQDNIALRLAASSVRIVAPIPGKRAVGIEVPNENRAIVTFRELIEQNLPEYKKMAVPVVLGKDIQGEAQLLDIAKTPHLLIAGSTGSGKSVCVNSIILSILYKRNPNEVKLILVDPKIVELKLYNDIPHLLTPVITEPKKALQSLQYCLCEMERRYALLDGLGVRDIINYNKRVEERHIATEKLPYIVVIIDEFADLMATTGKELESTIARLCAMSRAVGIHLVLATQRPSIDVITGLIKANIPTRIAFMVASKMDSRIIIDQVGAEKLLGRGDMLYASATDPFPVRIQGTYVSDDEVENVVEYVKGFGEPEYIDEEIFVEDEDDELAEPSLFSDGDDPLYNKALEIVLEAGKASASYLQRRLKIGYNRAARLVEEMEERGIVGPANGSKPREVIHMP